MKRRTLRGFTLVELLVVIAILGMLVALVIPQMGKAQARAQSVACMNNLRQIGIGVLGYVADNDNAFPMIEPNEDNPVYKPIGDSDKDDPDANEYEVEPLLPALEPYGVTEAVLKCPTDLRRSTSYFKERGTSYQWRITVDGENATAPGVYGRRGYGVRIVKPSRVTICTDFLAIHNGRPNRLYADGHVSKPH